MNRGEHGHHEDAPGRIPESLIHAALDGEVSDDMQREIADALNYDKARKQELIDTADAIKALRSEMHTPDFASSVLGELDRQNRFIPSSWQRLVRNGRMGVAAAILLSLVCVAGLQRVYPRLTTLGQQNTPLNDVAHAVESDAIQLQETIREEARTVRATLIPSPAMNLQTPGRGDFTFALAIEQVSGSIESPSGQIQVMTHPAGYLVYMPHLNKTTFVKSNPGASVISSIGWSRGRALGPASPNVIGIVSPDQFPFQISKEPQETKTLELP